MEEHPSHPHYNKDMTKKEHRYEQKSARSEAHSKRQDALEKRLRKYRRKHF